MDSKLESIRKKLHDAKQANRQDVQSEYTRKKAPPVNEKRQERLEKKVDDLKLKQLIATEQVDLDKLKSFEWTLEDVERWNEKQKEKSERADTGFTDYQQLAARKYNKLVREIKPNLAEYQQQKNQTEETLQITLAENRELTEIFQALESKPSQQAVQKMVNDLDQQLEKRAKFSKRKKIKEDDTVTYVNDRNMRYNRKIARAFDKYTGDIKAAFERGTALD